MHALARIDEDLTDRRTEALEFLSATRILVVQGLLGDAENADGCGIERADV